MHKVIIATWGQEGAEEQVDSEHYDLADAITLARAYNAELEGTATSAEVETDQGSRLAGLDLA